MEFVFRPLRIGQELLLRQLPECFREAAQPSVMLTTAEADSVFDALIVHILFEKNEGTSRARACFLAQFPPQWPLASGRVDGDA